MTKTRFGALAMVVALTVVPLTGCDAASEKVSTAGACSELVKTSVSELRRLQEERPRDPSAYREVAERFKDEAADVDDPEVRRAAKRYLRTMRRIAERAAETGKAPDIGALVEANKELAKACV
jgi:hypothetical protein